MIQTNNTVFLPSSHSCSNSNVKINPTSTRIKTIPISTSGKVRTAADVIDDSIERKYLKQWIKNKFVNAEEFTTVYNAKIWEIIVLKMTVLVIKI